MPAREVSVGRQQRMRAWDEAMSGLSVEDRFVDGVDQWGKLH